MALSEAGFIDRRVPSRDRRRRATPMLSRYTFFGRRRGFRRAAEEANSYVDWYGWRLSLVLTLIVVLSVLDALFTLLYVQKGGGELNPIMRRALEAGVGPFIGIKCALTIGGVLFLCLHKNFRFVKGLIGGVLVLYTLLLGYHFFLMAAV